MKSGDRNNRSSTHMCRTLKQSGLILVEEYWNAVPETVVVEGPQVLHKFKHTPLQFIQSCFDYNCESFRFVAMLTALVSEWHRVIPLGMCLSFSDKNLVSWSWAYLLLELLSFLRLLPVLGKGTVDREGRFLVVFRWGSGEAARIEQH